jgi:DNA polymerase
VRNSPLETGGFQEGPRSVVTSLTTGWGLGFLEENNISWISKMSKEKTFELFKQKYSTCQLCPLKDLRTQVVFGRGDLNAKLMIIGEAPGKDEDAVGQPFVGKAGNWLDRILKSVDIERRDIWITNTCLCRPKSEQKEKENRAPLVAEIEGCNPRLKEEIDIIRPSILVLCGRVPMSMATGYKILGKNRGWFGGNFKAFEHTVNHVYITYHPACLLYGSKEQRVARAHSIHEDWTNIARVYFEKKDPEESKCAKA